MNLLSETTLIAVERRKAEIFEIERLWTQLANLRGDVVSFRDLDDYINEYFQAKYGRDSLAFESIAQFTAHLESEIAKAENGESKIEIVALYADGGVVKKNPSPYGGTWAWVGVDAHGKQVTEQYGAVPATEARPITPNRSPSRSRSKRCPTAGAERFIRIR